MHFRTAILCSLLMGVRAVSAQDVATMAKEAHPSFEVATVKLCDPADENSGFHLEGHRIFIECETAQSMVMFAFNVHPRQIVNAPDWVSTEKFDVKGVPDAEGEPNLQQFREMTRKLLAERFHLKTRSEKREMTVYALRVAKGGPKLAKTASPAEAMADQTGNGHMMRFTANTMDNFAQGLQYMVDRPVVDETGLAGKYDFTLRWSPEGAPRDDPDAAQPLFTAIPEQLGLKLEATKTPAEALVVEHVERPSAN